MFWANGICLILVNMYPEVKIKLDSRHPRAQVHFERTIHAKTGQKNLAAMANPNTVVEAETMSA